jgi:hypothetical protein
MVQWENTNMVKHVWTRHMIQMDLEPDAIKTQLCYMYGSFSTRMKYLYPWIRLFEARSMKGIFSRNLLKTTRKYHCVSIDIFILVFYNKNVPRST